MVVPSCLLIPQCPAHWGTLPLVRPVLMVWGFAGVSWESLARHEVPMIASSPGLGTYALNGWDAGFAGINVYENTFM